MTPTPEGNEPDQDSVDRRAELLPEEQVVGSEDPQAQAQVILEESQERIDDGESGSDADSVQTADQDTRGGPEPH